MPKITPLRRWLTVVLVLGILLFAAFLWFRPLLHIGAGYAAKHACSCHFLQGRELAEIRKNDLNFSVLGQVSLGMEKNRVTASFYGAVRRTAVFRPNVGCTLLNDEEAEIADIRGEDAGAISYEKIREPAGLTPALDFGMRPVPGGEARGLVVMQNGRVIAERYAPGFSAETLLLGWSMTKTLTGLALGAHFTGEFAPASSPRPYLATKNLFPHWTDERAEITLADLLHMNSGLAWNEAYGAISDATIMLHEQPDFAAYASGMPLEHPVGTVWNYSSGTTNTLMRWLSEQFVTREALDSFLYHDLFGKVAPSLLIEPDQSGNPVGSSYGWATARDWANLGQLLLNDGIWNGDTLVRPDWIDWMRRAGHRQRGDLRRPPLAPRPGRGLPDLPGDAYMMRGFQDQRVFIIPSRDLVIARLGHGEDKVTDFNTLIKLS